MATRTKQSDLAVVRNGRKGRPPAIRAKVEALLYKLVFNYTRTETGCALIPEGIRNETRAAFANSLAESIWHELSAAGFRIIPSRLCQELALLLGEAGEPTPADDPALPKPNNPHVDT
jgi:hypothetical protein